MPDANDTNKTLPPTADLFAAMARVLEQRDQAIVDRASDRLRSAVQVSAQNVAAWHRTWASKPWAVVPAAMTPHQRWLCAELETRAADALSRSRAGLRAGRVAEAQRHHDEFATLFNESAWLRYDIFDLLRAGLPTQRVGETVVPPACLDRIPFRDSQERLARAVERSS